LDLHLIIQDIITRREGVVIPGLGSLISKYQSAEIDSQKKVIQPPKKEIHFNPNVTTDSDQILAHFIVSTKKVTLSRAQSLIQNFVQNIKNELAQKGKYTFKGIGTLKKGERGRIELVPEKDITSNLGFEEIPAEPFELEKTHAPGKKVTYAPPPPPPRRSRKKTILWITVSLLLLILIGGGYYIGFFDYLAYKIENQEMFRKISETSDRVTDNNTEKPEPMAEDTTLDSASVPKELRQALNRMTDKKRALMYKEPEENKTYHIIAGSFRIRDNALEYQNQLAGQGYTAKILENDSLFRISVKSFDKKEDALVELYQMRDTGKLKSIWLLAVQEKDR